MDDIVTIYKDVLAGNRKRFPRDTWSKDQDGYSRFSACLRYVTDRRGMVREDIVKIGHDFIRSVKLRGALATLYGENIKQAIFDTFPEHEFEKWEFTGGLESTEDIIRGLRELARRRGMAREDFLEERSLLYADPELGRVLGQGMRTGLKAAEMIKTALPEFEFTDEELKLHINRTERLAKIKRLFEDTFKWSKEDIENKLTWEIAHKHFPEALHEYGNVLKVVQAIYPDIHHLKAMKRPLSDEAKKQIIQDLRDGAKTKDIIEKYGIGRTTVARIKREKGLPSQTKDIAGQTFGTFYVVRKAEDGKWECRCRCGDIKFIQKGNLVHGNVKTCGKAECRRWLRENGK